MPFVSYFFRDEWERKNRWAGQLFLASTILDVEASVHLILLLVFKLVSRYKNKKLGKE